MLSSVNFSGDSPAIESASEIKEILTDTDPNLEINPDDYLETR
jgi:hypothetical protein